MTLWLPARSVVAGFDGSEQSCRAVGWAAAQADRCHGVLVVAGAIDWGWPAGRFPETAIASLSGGADRLRESGKVRLEEIVADLRDTHPELDVRDVLLGEQPARALSGFVTKVDAAMLVIGPPGKTFCRAWCSAPPRPSSPGYRPGRWWSCAVRRILR
ncbi:universal stress protein [Amycolatopsis sp. NBC_01307]|uniref:universal stress protein n=1 Tax=Amycolatopsis sp. NBC_01307 TaxID=2903561 RepID=UPI002E1556D2|nr:universal stress protein [Amycolatopsis sp. NBC_01307]